MAVAAFCVVAAALGALRRVPGAVVVMPFGRFVADSHVRGVRAERRGDGGTGADADGAERDDWHSAQTGHVYAYRRERTQT